MSHLKPLWNTPLLLGPVMVSMVLAAVLIFFVGKIDRQPASPRDPIVVICEGKPLRCESSVIR